MKIITSILLMVSTLAAVAADSQYVGNKPKVTTNNPTTDHFLMVAGDGNTAPVIRLNLSNAWNNINLLSTFGGIDLDAQLYIARAGISNAVGKYRLDGFVKTLKQYDLWDDLVDAVPLSSLMQQTNSTTMQSVKNQFASVTLNGGAIRGLRGVAFDGVNDYLIADLATPLQTFTTSIIVQGSTNATTHPSGWFGLHSAAGDQYHIFGTLSTDYDLSWILTQGDGGGNTGHYLITYDVGGPFRGYTHRDTVRKYITWASDSTGVDSIAWANGSRTLLLGTTTNRTFTTGADIITLGARWDTGVANGFQRCNSAGFLVFNTKLNDLQASNLVECMRWLDPATENLVIAGDSMSRQLDPSATYAFWDGWPSAIEMHSHVSNRYAIFNNAYNGVSAAAYSYDLNIRPYGPHQGGVEKSTLIIWLGYNDFNGGATAAATYAAVATLADKARNDGFRVGVALPPISATMVGGAAMLSVTNVQAYHSLILTNREKFDFVVRLDNVFGSTNTVDGWQTDGLHPSAVGELAVAQVMSQTLSGVRDVAQHGMWNQSATNINTGTTNLLFRWQPGNELRTKGDIVRYRFAGGFSNDVTHAKQVTIQYGSETVLDPASRVAHNGSWSAEVIIQHITPTSQLVEAKFTGAATNFTKLTYTTQTNWLPTLVKASGTGPGGGSVTNELISWKWEPLR